LAFGPELLDLADGDAPAGELSADLVDVMDNQLNAIDQACAGNIVLLFELGSTRGRTARLRTP